MQKDPTHQLRGSRKFCQRGSNTDVFFLYYLVEGIERGSNCTHSWPSSACQRNDIEMVFRWRADSGPPLNTGLVAL